MEKGLGRKHLAQALRQKKYTQNNPEMAKLSQTRKRVALTKKRRSDPEFDTAFKKKIAEKKREQRLRKKSGIRENELVPQGELSLYLGGDVDDIIDILYEGELNVIEEPSVSEEDDREIGCWLCSLASQFASYSRSAAMARAPATALAATLKPRLKVHS